MKKQPVWSAIMRKSIRNIFLLVCGLLVTVGVHAQEKKMAAMAEQPVALSMTTFLNNDYSGSSSHIYPGAIYTYQNFYDGSYKEQQGDRNPLTIVTDNTNIKGKPYVVVDNPNDATIRAAVDDLFKESKAPAANESLAYQVYETSTLADESLKISGGVARYAASLSASYHTGSSSKSRILTIDAIKTLFSINTIPPKGGFLRVRPSRVRPISW